MSDDAKCPYVVGRTTLHCLLTPFTLTDAEREVIQRALEYKERIAGDAAEPRGWMAMQADADADVLRGCWSGRSENASDQRHRTQERP